MPCFIVLTQGQFLQSGIDFAKLLAYPFLRKFAELDESPQPMLFAFMLSSAVTAYEFPAVLAFHGNHFTGMNLAIHY